MDDALVQAALDTGGRAYWCGPVPGASWDHWFRSFADAARVTLHVRVLRGCDRHHIVEAAFKATGLALRDALVDSAACSAPRARCRSRRDDAHSTTHRLPRCARRALAEGHALRGPA
jgi:imidazoleglycerol phosphate dehydratase HisB